MMIRTGLNQLRDWTVSRLLRRMHRVTYRLSTTLRSVEPTRVLLIAPHMDDGMISSGGSLALHKQAGSDVGIVYVSDCRSDAPGGGGDDRTNIRHQEAIRACTFMGVEIVDILGVPDGKLSLHETQIAKRLGDLIEQWKPRQVFCPYPTDHHRDHQATAVSTSHALAEREWNGEVWGYEVWSSLWPNAAVDISSVVEKKKEVISFFASQVAGTPYIDASLGLNRYRGLQASVDYAEAFFVSSPKRFGEMCRHLNRI